MTANKRFTNIEHDYENAWIKCNDNGDFMIYLIYKELDESLPSLEDLLNELNDKCEFLEIENEALEDAASRYAELCHKSLKENEQLKKENEELKQELLEVIDASSDNRLNKKGFAGSGRFA